MKVYELTSNSIPVVANLMCKLKPEWWDYEGACEQLSSVNVMIKSIGWYLGESKEIPKGWFLCRELVGYHALELECSGFDDNGEFKAEHKLDDIYEVAEKYAKSQGYLTFRSAISSVGFNIHEKNIDSISNAIDTLKSERLDYKWYLNHGFRVIGIQPNAYAKGFHLIMLAKDISE